MQSPVLPAIKMSFDAVFYYVNDLDRAVGDARNVALGHAGNMTPCYVYDDCGKLMFSAGKP
jgi:hypothetical protein